mgnify:CR=1 FL=1
MPGDQSYSKVPIIMLTARSDEKDELQGFDLAWMNIFPSRSAEDSGSESRGDSAPHR